MKTTHSRDTRAFKTLSWILRLLTAGLLAHAAWGKFAGNEHALMMFESLGMGAPGRFLIGLLESFSALLILTPQGAVYGAFLSLGVMTGAIIAHLTMIGFEGLPHALVVAVGSLAILYRNRHDASFLSNLFDH